MEGWKMQYGELTNINPTSKELWNAFNHFFSNQTHKTNTYKFVFLKSILDNLLNAKQMDNFYIIEFNMIFERFTINYWNLINKYNLHQMPRYHDKRKSAIENVFKEAFKNLPVGEISYDGLNDKVKKSLLNEIQKRCSNYVVGALYTDLKQIVYSFNKKEKAIKISNVAYYFMMENKMRIEKLNYYEWAKYLEKFNDDFAIIRVLNKLEDSTPKRSDLSIYRDLLYYEFHQQTCFYCGKKINPEKNKVHVDHFVPWMYVKTDNLWNLVLACNKCNLKKNDKLPSNNSLKRIEYRNLKLRELNTEKINKKIENYNSELLDKVYESAINNGLIVDNNF